MKILGSQVIEDYFPTVESKKEKNRRLALQAVEFVRRNILFSSNNPNIHNRLQENCSYEGEFSKDIYIKKCKGIETVLGRIREVYVMAQIGITAGLRKLKIVSEMALKYSVGNCYEKSAAALFFLKEQDSETPVELYDIEEGEHCFIVIGRKRSSDPKDYKTWGEDALICDLWAEKVFAVSEVERELYDFESLSYIDYIPQLKLFDPRTQSLNLSQ